ncbi:MAG: diacylglycerol kinase [Solidesulfovibrio sp.]|uniref:diacylglycerol kinase n=1 Tax=Solidesulfovibrio sp. TaxID=2910990 RepID=UPI002B1ECEA1|nr:diacylglycerol kinase [Solidesulfovibrio sp.]MEA4858159.1 diacylglycerol kinase [Solidesulfovibrio sp.]
MRNKFLGTGEPGWHPVRKVLVVLSGLRFAVLYDASVAWKVVVSVAVLAIFAWAGHWRDFCIVLVATGQMLAVELVNSAIEGVCDFLVAHEDKRIKAIKDMAAAGAGIGIAFWLLVIVWEAGYLVDAWPGP